MIEKGTAGIASVEKLLRHYRSRGIVFIVPEDRQGWGIRTSFMTGTYDDGMPE